MNHSSGRYKSKAGPKLQDGESSVQEPGKETREEGYLSISSHFSHFRLRLLVFGFAILFFVKFNVDHFRTPGWDVSLGDLTEVYQPLFQDPSLDDYLPASATDTTRTTNLFVFN